jgi:hypothetical protein
MIDPFDIPLEGRKQLIYAIKGVSRLFVPEVPVIALARLVVIPEHACSTDHVGKTVLVRMG